MRAAVARGPRTPLTSSVVTLALCVVLALARASFAAQASWDELEARQATIVSIEIVVRDVFDLARPSEDTWIGRTANRLHIETRTDVVARELLIVVGEPVNAERIRETERNLRRLAFVRDARIVPVPTGATVRARVEVEDAWSLLGNVDFSQTGGNTEWSVRLDEVNLFGHGKRVFVEHEQTIERTANAFGYVDPQFFNSRWILSTGYSDLSDGSSRFVLMERPYFSVETPYSVGGFVSTSDHALTHYDQGLAVRVIPVRVSAATLFASRAYRVRNRTALRAGLTYRAVNTEFDDSIAVRPNQLPLPVDRVRRVRALLATWSVVQDRPVALVNMAGIGHTEDYNVGWRLSAGLGYGARAFGGTVSAPVGEVAIGKGWTSGDGRALLLMSGSFRGRHQADGWRDAIGGAAATYYGRVGRHQTIAAHVSVTSSADPDSAGWLYLGGRDGLRGYVDHFLAGDRRIAATLEDRVITSWRPFGLVQLGFVASADAGVIRRPVTGRWSRVYANVGGGLRLGLPKSGRAKPIEVSVAVPLVREPGADWLFVTIGNTVEF